MSSPGSGIDPNEPHPAGIAELRQQFNELAWKVLRAEPVWYGHFGMTRLQASALLVIEQFGPGIDMVTLSTLTSLPPSSITSIVDRFVEQGYVTRQRDERDRRRVTATITDAGLVKVTELEAHSARILASMLHGIDETDIATVTRVFRHMTDRLDHLGLENLPSSQPERQR